jgi:hypothetical protein
MRLDGIVHGIAEISETLPLSSLSPTLETKIDAALDHVRLSFLGLNEAREWFSGLMISQGRKLRQRTSSTHGRRPQPPLV